MTLVLRDYQRGADAEDERLAESGVKSIVVVAPTGSGKSVQIAACAVRYVTRGRRVLALAHRAELLDQLCAKLVLAGVPASDIALLAGGRGRAAAAHAPVVVASIQSLGDECMDAGLVIVDEAHRSCGPAYRRELARRRARSAHVRGYTATPVRLDGQGLGDVYERMLVAATPRQMVTQGWIAEPEVWTVPAAMLPDVGGVARRGGDFDPEALAVVVRAGALIGSVAEHWSRRARGLRTLVFAANRAHSRELCAALTAVGARVAHVDGDTPKAERTNAIARLRTGDLDVVSNCELLIEGLDVPECKCVVLARPTQSLTIFLQQVGRALRPWQGITPIVLDHAGNALRHGLPTDDRAYSLDGRYAAPPEPVDGEGDRTRTCAGCYLVVAASEKVCPACGKDLTVGRVPRTVKTLAGQLVELSRSAMDARTAAWNQLWIQAHREGYKPAWVARAYAEKFAETPPAHLRPMPRPAYTTADRRAFLKKLWGIAGRMGRGESYVKERYEQKFGEPMRP